MSDRNYRTGAKRHHLDAVCIGVSDRLRPLLGDGVVSSGKKQLFLHHCRFRWLRNDVPGTEPHADELGHPKKSSFPFLDLHPLAVSRNHDYRGVPHPHLLF